MHDLVNNIVQALTPDDLLQYVPALIGFVAIVLIFDFAIDFLRPYLTDVFWKEDSDGRGMHRRF